MGDSCSLTIEEIFSDYKPRFIRFAYSYIHDITMSEDIVIDAIIYYWERKNELENINIPAYILTTIKHKCLNYLKRQHLKYNVTKKIITDAQWDLSARIASLSACEPYELFTDDMKKTINDALNKLPEKTRNIFKMSRYENMSNKEISEKYNISIKGVEFHISKALSLLRAYLKDYYLLLFPFFF